MPKVGDEIYVRVSKRKTWMSHFKTDFKGILGLNYHQQCGGGDRGDKHQWTVIHPKYGSISWYDEDDFTVTKKATPAMELKARRLMDG